MTSLGKLYFDFWSKAVPLGDGFLPIHLEDMIPSNTPFPYLTYSLTRNDMFENGLDQVRIWTHSQNIIQLSSFLDSVAEAVPHQGVVLELPDGNGALWLMRGTPFQQRQPMPEDEPGIQVGYVNIATRSYIL